MTTDIVEGPDDALLVTHDNQRKARNRDGDRVSRVDYIVSKGDTDPGARKQPFLLQVKKSWLV